MDVEAQTGGFRPDRQESGSPEAGGSAVLDAFERLVAGIADRVGPATVGVRAAGGAGSGVVVADGVVLTNAHNVRGREVTLHAAGDRGPATVVGLDPDADLAVLAGPTPGATPVEWTVAPAAHASAPPGIGAVVVALARPGGRGLRVTWGTVSATDQAFRGPRGRRLGGSIEHTAPLPRGSSGGPLVDRVGRLVGLNTNRLGDGFYLALPADAHLRELVDGLRSGTAAPRPRLGVAIAPEPVARRLRAAVGLPERDGLLVHGVTEDGPAAAAGLRRGDLIVGAGGRDVSRIDDLHRVIDDRDPGTALQLRLLRGVDELSLTVELPGA